MTLYIREMLWPAVPVQEARTGQAGRHQVIVAKYKELRGFVFIDKCLR
jgi:hypothetical protein